VFLRAVRFGLCFRPGRRILGDTKLVSGGT